MKNKYELLDLLYEIPRKFTGDNLTFQLYLSKCVANFNQPKNGRTYPYEEVYLGLKELKFDFAKNNKNFNVEIIEDRIKPYTILIRSLQEIKKVKK